MASLLVNAGGTIGDWMMCDELLLESQCKHLDKEENYTGFTQYWLQPALKCFSFREFLIIFQNSGSYVELRLRTLQNRRENGAPGRELGGNLWELYFS